MPSTTDFHVTVFEAIPSPIFVVDRDLCVIDFNTAAAKLPNAIIFNALRPRGGEMLGCVHADGAGCGQDPACRGCSIQKLMRDAFDGGYICRRAVAMQLRTKNGASEDVDFLVSAAPFRDGREPLLLVILENLNQIATLWDRTRSGRMAAGT